MKTHSKAFYGAVLALIVIATPFAAQARPFGHGPGQGAGVCQQAIPQEQQEAFAKLMREHRDKMQPLHDQMWVKSRTLDALSNNPKAEPKELQALVNELAALRIKQREERTAFAEKVKAQTGVDLADRGNCPMMNGHGSGDGRHGGKGGMGGGHGGRGGHGGGYGGNHGGNHTF